MYEGRSVDVDPFIEGDVLKKRKKNLNEKKGLSRGENGDIKGVKEEKCTIIYWEWKKKKNEIKIRNLKDFLFISPKIDGRD